jgi:hypothetical protein
MPSLKPGDDPTTLRFLLGLVGLYPKLSFEEFELKPYALESEGIQFILRWDQPADLDLEVIDPDKNVIAFDNPMQGDGRLELDANSLCEPSPTNAESIAWPAGKEPPGEYEVRANMYDSCGVDSTFYEVVVVECGTSKSYTGTFNASDVDTSGTGRHIDFIKHSCTQRVSGTVRYEKRFPLTNSVNAVVAQKLPVRVIRSADGEVLARGFTDNSGKYSLQFANSGDGRYKVEVEATYADSILSEPRASVAELNEDVPYRFQGPEIDGAATPIATQDLRIEIADYSGAYNIIDVIRRGLEWVLAKKSVLLSPIGVRWGPGADTGTSYFNGSQLFILGTTKDPDEFDDSVISHELMHYVVSQISDDDSLGGSHDGGFSGPRLSWGEGLATGLGQIALGNSLYFDSRGSGAVVSTDLETGARVGAGTPVGFAKGTKNGTQEGDISEYLIAMVLWDLQDGANEPHDRIDKAETALYKSLFEVVPAANTDRGVWFTDFVDFLDGFRCMSGPDYAAKTDPALKDLLRDRDFNYDFATSGIGCDP